MQDGIIAGNGNSRYLKTVAEALSLYPTYQDFIAALIAGTFPIDLNGINTAGWVQQGTALNKANLLADVTASSIGLGGNATPNEAFSILQNQINNLSGIKTEVVSGSYQGDNTQNRTINLGFMPKAVLLVYNGYKFSSNGIMGGLVNQGFSMIYQPSTYNAIILSITTNGFIVNKFREDAGGANTNASGNKYVYIAFK